MFSQASLGPFGSLPLRPSFFFCLKNGVQDRFLPRRLRERALKKQDSFGGRFVCLSCPSRVAAPSRWGRVLLYRPVRYGPIYVWHLSPFPAASPIVTTPMLGDQFDVFARTSASCPGLLWQGGGARCQPFRRAQLGYFLSTSRRLA